MPKKTKRPKPVERPLTPAENKELQDSVAAGYKLLKLKPGVATAEEVQEAILAKIDPVFLGKKKLTKKGLEDTGLYLGALWGQSLCDKLGWEWCHLTLDGDESYSVAAPNRAYAIAAMSFIFQQLHKRLPEENTSLLLYNMVTGGSLPKAKKGAYITIG